MYFQMANTRSEDIAQKMRKIEEEINIRLRRHSLPASEKEPIMQQVQKALMEGNKDSLEVAILLADLLEPTNRNFNHGGIEEV